MCSPEAVDVSTCAAEYPLNQGDMAALGSARANLSWAVRVAKRIYAQKVHSQVTDTNNMAYMA